jgi:transposase
MFSYLSPEERVPDNHPLRPIRTMVDVALKALSPAFGCLYSVFGRPSIPPEKLLRALLLQVLYTVRSERMLMEQLEYNLLFRWFVGLNMDEAVWVPTVFSKNRDRLLEGDIAEKFFRASAGAGAGGRPAFRRALQRGRDADRGLGEPKEFSAERPTRAATQR